MTTFNVLHEGPVNALALNRNNTQVAIGGRSVFKVYAIEDDKFREICNLRASKHLNLSFSCNDVSWSSTDDNYLATAATNGHVCLWNLTKMGKAMQEQDYQEHKRTVNKVNFHASEPNRLISGSQDGTMRYFDIRLKSAVAIFYSNTESVRDVQFSPHNPHTFAAVSENGSVQLWDVRRADKCQQQYTAHSGPIFACDWHPDNTWLATASRDKTIKVWDLTNKPTLEYTIHTIASIGHVKWRPQREFHIASCALVIDCSINIWDVRRPYIPFAAFNEHKDITSRVAWRGDPHTFLSSGRDGLLYQHAFNDATRPASRANSQGISLNTKGEVLYAHKVSVNINTLTKTAVGLITQRKISTTQPASDQFHQAASTMQQFIQNSPRHNQESNAFIELAKNYMLDGDSLSRMCEHNSTIAKQFGKMHISLIWKIIKTMFGEEFLPKAKKSNTNNDEIVSLVPSLIGNDFTSNERKSEDGDTPAQYSGEEDNEGGDVVDHAHIYHNNVFPYLNFRPGAPKGDFGENELEISGQSITSDSKSSLKTIQVPKLQDWTLPTEAFQIRNEIPNPSPTPSEDYSSDNQSCSSDNLEEHSLSPTTLDQPPGLLSVKIVPRKSTWDPGNIVMQALMHHANLGDIQTAACVLMVLGEHRHMLRELDEVTQEHWLLGYIDLLGRFRLWNIAAEVIKLSWLPSVFQLNQQSTRINTNCGKCSKPLQRIGWLCDKCHLSSHASCSVCHQVVKGLYAWCQGCSHGGHLDHMMEWMAKNKRCPTGCGHTCEFR